MFNHEVIGLRNKSFGLMIDLWCCLIQRDFNARTPIVYDYLSVIGGAMLDPSSVKVIVFAHSQGALILSAVVKLIEREAILQGVKHKVEMYTIGSAARSFGTRKYCGQEIHGGFGRVEHYSNEWDWVARTGVLSNIEASVGVHYIRKKQAGHLPLIHYFPDDRFLVSSPGSKLATYLKSVQNKRRARKARRQKAKHA
ncbi:hypothetical protein I316_02315 [Kwoniella heveanensis BCC8398]|uniref:DUF676 domain-containing protein n=1 Tax=Kwoniella heveanensis BCC8398 TaxID=1296120 RepID=A0A1B9GXR9_9TREE|nr:hypothetical protein I316_02315 [Kwoniella heveanensis BCC8398]